MTEAGSDPRERDDAEELVDELSDLDVPDDMDVTGGALNTYVAQVQGEKQGGPKG